MSDAIEDLYRLKRLRDEGGISDEQYEIQREAALARAARKGTASVQQRPAAPVALLAMLAIALSIGALLFVLSFRQTPAPPAPPRPLRPSTPAASRLIPNGMTTWDGSQSMSAPGTQDMTPPDASAAGATSVADAAPDAPPAAAAPPPPAALVVVQSQVQIPVPAPSATPTVPQVTTTATDLSQAFQNNAADAEARLAGRRIVVTGQVDHAILDIPDYPALDLQGSDPQHDVGVNLDRSSAARAGALTPGERVTVTCDAVTNMSGVPMLDRCVL